MSTHWRILVNHSPHYYMLCNRPLEGVTRWFCLQPFVDKESSLRDALAAQDFDCATYGKILASGTGESPPSHILWELNQRFAAEKR